MFYSLRNVFEYSEIAHTFDRLARHWITQSIILAKTKLYL